MSDFLSFILGVIQGLTEFLPVSSSGHLAVAQAFWLKETKSSLLIEVFAHLGSLFSILIFYRNDFMGYLSRGRSLWSHESLRELFPIVIACVPAVLTALLFETFLIRFFGDLRIVALGFLITSVLLLSTWKRNSDSHGVDQKDWPSLREAFYIGCAQALALIPGVSRSASTIASGMWLGLKPEKAAYFSFCAVIPLIFAASMKSAFELIVFKGLPQENISSLLIVCCSSFLVGWGALALLISFVGRGKFFYFSFYLIPLSLFLFFKG